jgi:DNA polymerase
MMLGNHVKVGLEKLAEFFNLPPKSVPYELFQGFHWHELAPAVRSQVAAGACHDVELTWEIFKRLMTMGFPYEELDMVDLTVRMFTEPMVIGDVELLAEIWQSEAKNKQETLIDLELDKKIVNSTEGFAELLRMEGIEPDTKEGKNGPTYAFSKRDYFMQELLECDNNRLRTLAEARLGLRSSLLQTRAERWGHMATRGPMCVYLNYCGAHTTRWSGGDKTNFQNATRVDPDNPRTASPLRKSLMAPKGWKFAIVDLSQIERRITAWLAGEWEYLKKFERGEDVYIGTASRFYGREITVEDKEERQLGKIVELQCQFGSGGPKIVATLRNFGIIISQEEGLAARDAFRAEHPLNVELWRVAERYIAFLANGAEAQWGPMAIRDKRIWLPNGAPLIYETLEYHIPALADEAKQSERPSTAVSGQNAGWRLKLRNGWTKLYGGKLVENVVQALARVVFSEAVGRSVKLGYRLVLQSHDEGVFLVPDDGEAEASLAEIRNEFRRIPSWLPGIPLDASGILGDRYAK